MELMRYADSFREQTGKVSDKWSSYLDAYSFWLSEWQDKPVRIFEIGIQNGGHLEVLARYFSHSKIVLGCDINPNCEQLVYQDKRIQIIVGDVNDDSAHKKITTASANFDIIIDDGSHTQKDIVASFARYFPLLSDGGIYIVEDLHCSYWKEFGGGLFDPFSAMGFLKKIADIINVEHWGNAVSLQEFLKQWETKYQITFDVDSFRHIHRLSFENSLCIIIKNCPTINDLGTRAVVGDEALVDDTPLKLRDTSNTFPSQLENPFSSVVNAFETLSADRDSLLLERATLERERILLLQENTVLLTEAAKIKKIKDSRVGRLLWSLMSKLNIV